MPVLGGSANVRTLVNLESVVCVPSLSDLLSLPAKEEEEDLAVYTYVLCESYMSVLLKEVPCLWQVKLVTTTNFRYNSLQ